MTTLAEIRQELLRIAPCLGIESLATSGGVNSIEDSSVLQGSAEITAAYRGQWIHRPAATGADRDKRATTLAGAALSHAGSNYNIVPVNGELYGLWIVDFRELFAELLRVMDELPQAILHPLCGGLDLSDGDMQASGVSNWTGVNATPVKTTTAGDVLPGMAQGLQVTLTSADGYARSADINVIRSRTVDIYTVARNKGAGTASLNLYDRTAGADTAIGTALTHTEEDWVHMWRRESLGAAVEKIAVGLGGVANNGVAEWAYCAVYPDNWRVYDLPSWFRNPSNLRAIKCETYDFASGSGLSDWRSRQTLNLDPYDYRLQRIHQGVTAYNLILNRTPSTPLMVEAMEMASTFTAFADTAAGETAPITALDKEYVALHWAKGIFETLVPASDARRQVNLPRIERRLQERWTDEPLGSKVEEPRVIRYGNSRS